VTSSHDDRTPFFARIWSATAIMGVALLISPDDGFLMPLLMAAVVAVATAWAYLALRDSKFRYLASAGLGSAAFFLLTALRNFHLSNGGSGNASALLAIGMYVLVFIAVTADWPRRVTTSA
jgi:hypothetical protein